MQRVTCIALSLVAVGCTSGELGPGSSHLVFTQLSAGTGFTCALTGDGTAYCWGVNDKGQLGDGTTTDRAQPTQVATSVRFTTISSGPTHSCGLTDNGAAYCWGANEFGKLGSGPSGTASMTPTAINGNLRFVSIAAGLNNTCTTTDQRQVYCWGQIAETNQFGDFLPKTVLDPQLIPGSMVAVVAGDDGGYCSVDSAALGYCWGLFYFFPASGPALHQLLDDGEVDFSMAFNPAEGSSLINAGRLPKSVRTSILKDGTIGNTHFVAIPFNAAHKAAAMVVADFLMSPEAQAHKQDPRVWGDGTVLDLAALDLADRTRFEALPQGVATLPPDQLVPVRSEPHPSWMTAIEAEWLKRFSS